MKKLFYLLLLIAGFVNGQIVNIPDAVFKAKLLAADISNDIAIDFSNFAMKIDANSDGEIQNSEALAVQWLNVGNSNISSIEGILSFTNLQYLHCSNNTISSIDVSGLSNLQYFDCDNNQLSSINVNGLTNLITLNCYLNQLVSLNVNGLTNLITLNCYQNQLVSLNVSDLTNLTALNCYQNQLVNLNMSGLINLNLLDCKFNNLLTIDLQNFTNLQYILCNDNQIVSLNVSGLQNLLGLNCFDNQLTNLNLLGATSLIHLECQSNNLTTLDISGLINLEFIAFDLNQISTINLNGLTKIQYFSCTYNLLTELDVSGLIELQSLWCRHNLLTNLYVKNGVNETGLFFMDNPNLVFICADEQQIADIQSKITEYGYTNCIVNSYCSFTPGGDYNTINGAIISDANSNGCDTNDLKFPNIKLKINDGINEGATFSSNLDNYKFYTQAGTFTVTPIVENPAYFNVSPANTIVNFPLVDNSISTHDFCITPNGIHPDLEIVLAPVTPARPGFDAVYKLVYKNKGNQTQSGNIVFGYNQAVLSLVASVPNYTSIPSAGFYNYEFSNLLPFESRTILFTFHVNAPTDTPAVNIGDVLNFSTYINSNGGIDETPVDNAFLYHQTVVGSYDPNDIACLEGEIVSPAEIGNYLHYMVNFENTGNYAAENVVVKIEIDANKFDIASLQLLDSSNPVDARVTGNKVEFIFKNIQLAGPGGHGNILLKIKSKNNLVTGDMVSKIANIYFDYNAPVTTLPFDTTFQTLGLNNPNSDNSIAVFPNPTSNFVTVNSKNTIKSLQLCDVQGRLLQTNFSNQKETKIDISSKANGVYFLKITSEVGFKIEKVVKK